MAVTGTLARSADQTGPQEPGAGSLFDGTYHGSSQPVAVNTQSCRQSREVSVQISNGRLKLPWNERQLFNTTVSRDGRFFATTGSSVQAEKHMIVIPTLRGSVSNTGLVADYGTRLCNYRLAASLPPEAQHLSQRTDGVDAPQ